MMTQADILAKNDKCMLVENIETNQDFEDQQQTASRPSKPTNFGKDFPAINLFNLNEQSPIRPSKYFATDSAMNASKGLRNIIIGGIVFSAIVTIALFIQIAVGPTQVPTRIGIITQEKVCSEIGADMVRKGGNSIDAFIASQLCLGVVNPFAAGLGAGGFLLVRDHKHASNVALNCFFKSGGNLDPLKYKTRPTSARELIAVPGELKCLQYVYHKYARFYWKVLSAPAIRLAREGFTVSKLLAEHLKQLSLDDIKRNPHMADMYLNENGTLVQEGEVIKNVPLAETIKLVGDIEHVMYHADGRLGIDLTDELSNKKGEQQITLNDLVNYKIKDDTLVTVNYNDFVLLTSSYPSIGPAIKFIIELVASLPRISVSDFKSADVYSKILEASRLGYLLSSYISDPLFGHDLSKLYTEKFADSEDYIKNFSTTYPFKTDDTKIVDNLVTNFVSVNDHNDYMVSYVGTLGSAWGANWITKAGYFLNDGLNLFSYEPEIEDLNPGNSFDINKQPRGLIAPILTFNKKNPCMRRFSISYSHQGHEADDFALSELTQVILKLFTDFSMFENSLVDRRLQFCPKHHDKSPMVCYESGFDPELQSQISRMNAYFKTDSCSFHSIDLVMKKDHVVYGHADTNRSDDALVLFN